MEQAQLPEGAAPSADGAPRAPRAASESARQRGTGGFAAKEPQRDIDCNSTLVDNCCHDTAAASPSQWGKEA